jgi:hypothetical protein
VRIATPAGIGAFLAHLGLQSAEGIGVVVGDIATAVTLGGCPPEKQTKLVAYDDACRMDGICITRYMLRVYPVGHSDVLLTCTLSLSFSISKR